MITYHNFTPTADILPVLIAQMAYLATLCQCGMLGKVMYGENGALLCGRCAIIAYGAVPNDEVCE